MLGLQKFGMIAVLVTLLVSPAAAQNLAKYRDYEFGMSVDSVAKQTQSEPSNVKTAHVKPDLIQTLQWNIQGYFASSSSSGPESARSIRFDFYNNQLFRLLVSYSSKQVEGLTAGDFIDAITKVYGPATTPDESVVVSAYTGYEDRQKVLARWENAENTYSLFRSSYGGEYGLLASSKRLGTLAGASIKEAEKLEALAAPQREADRRQKEADDRKVLEEKARAVNKADFRP